MSVCVSLSQHCLIDRDCCKFNIFNRLPTEIQLVATMRETPPVCSPTDVSDGGKGFWRCALGFVTASPLHISPNLGLPLSHCSLIVTPLRPMVRVHFLWQPPLVKSLFPYRPQRAPASFGVHAPCVLLMWSFVVTLRLVPPPTALFYPETVFFLPPLQPCFWITAPLNQSQVCSISNWEGKLVKSMQVSSHQNYTLKMQKKSSNHIKTWNKIHLNTNHAKLKYTLKTFHRIKHIKYII